MYYLTLFFFRRIRLSNNLSHSGFELVIFGTAIPKKDEHATPSSTVSKFYRKFSIKLYQNLVDKAIVCDLK